MKNQDNVKIGRRESRLAGSRTSLQQFLKSWRLERLGNFKEKINEIDWSVGDTRHNQMQSAFASAAARGIDPEVAEEFIREKIESNGGWIDDRGIRRAREHHYGLASENQVASGPKMPRVKMDPDLVKKVTDITGDLDASEILKRRSDVDPDAASLEEILGTLYEEGENLLIFKNPRSQGDVLYEVGTPIPEDLPMRAEEGIFFLTAPVDGESYPNPREEGKKSRRSEESITAFRYLLLESDEVPAEEWLKVLIHLPLPIAAVYSSGGKSIHSLVRVGAANKAEYDEVRQGLLGILQALGADRQATSAVRLSRLPTAFRGERQQELLYLKHNPEVSPIFEIEENR